MKELTQEEKDKIYLEEKARREAQQLLENEEKIKAEKLKKQKQSENSKGCLILLCVIIGFPIVAALFSALSSVLVPLLICGFIGFMVYKTSTKEKGILSALALFLVFVIATSIYSNLRNISEQKQAEQIELEKATMEAKISPEARILNVKQLIKKVDINSKAFGSQHSILTKAKEELSKLKDPKNKYSKQIISLNTNIASLEKKLSNQESFHKKEEERKNKQAEKLIAIVLRKEFAKKYESSLLDQGLNVTVTTSGNANTILNLEYIFVSKVLAHQLANKSEMFDNLRNLGFKKFIITDGYDEEWYWDL